MLVSVIVPALDEADNIAECVRCARRGYDPSQVEIIVVDGGSTDGTPEAVPTGAMVIASPRGRAIQMNRGAEEAHGDLLLFCHADSRLPDGWREATIDVMQTPGVSGGAFERRYEPAKGLMLRFLNSCRSFGWWWATHGERCQFTSKAIFQAIGGFPSIPLMEDVELSRALHRRGKIKITMPRVVTSSRRLLENGVIRQGLLVQWYCFRYLVAGATAAEIARSYRSSREDQAERNARHKPIAGR